MPIRICDDDVTIVSDEVMLSKIVKAIEAVSLGKSYSITGSRSYTSHDLDDLLRLRDDYEARVLRKKGAIGKNLSDFSGE